MKQKTASSKKINAFCTIYAFAREYVQAGTRKNKDLSLFINKKLIMKSFKQELQRQLRISIDTNTWLLEQNELKDIHTGKKSLKKMCEAYYYEAVNGAKI